MDHVEDIVVSGFECFEFSEALMQGIREAGFRHPSPIQAQAIPVILSGRDLVAQAQTGTGKTAAFGLPSMQRIQPDHKGVSILVITPTRELASQVSDELYRLGRFAGVRTVSVYGGQSSRRQIELIERGPQIVVATPGRLLDHLSSGRLEGFAPSIVILDEADEMLDMGFLEDIKTIFTYLPEERQTLLFSATMPPPIHALARQILKDPYLINLASEVVYNSDVEQYFYVIEENERCDAVVRLIDSEEPSKAIIFCRTKREADLLCTTLISRGYAAKPLHGDMDQQQRQDAIQSFRDSAVDILVATDVASRGLDVSGLTHVFNYHMPFDQESYLHRIGRTGRAGQKGKAITLVTPFEFRKLRRIQTAIRASFTHGEIPSIADVHQQHNQRLIEALYQQPLRKEAVEVLSRLQEEMDLTEVACKLISMLIDKRRVHGPNRIGFNGQQLQALLKPAKPRRNNNKPYGSGQPVSYTHLTLPTKA
jgi:ATP-dependent RNA helicase DeaD